ncbi:MAG: PP2C family protein-serine/threonine phosphatase [Ignavibacteria bacterium]|nr:PP2C family protein-serine/threonine phosphatase [Ignavibacteria bacterium]
MDQHKLYNTIRLMTEQNLGTEEELICHVLENIIRHEAIPVKGGRIWKLDPPSMSYRLALQMGDVEQIGRDFRLKIEDYPLFLQLPQKGTIVQDETNQYLREHGITVYSATGVGEKVHLGGHVVFPYVIAINGDYLPEDMTYALNIIGSVLTSALQSRRIESKAKLLEADLDKAREIQKSILPEHELSFHAYDIYGISIPDRVVGGDFFDYLDTAEDSDRLGVVIGDAASKGLSAAAQALYVSGALRMGIEYQTKMNSYIGKINRLVNKTFSPEQFISLFYLELTTSEKGLVFYVNAGHSHPMLLRRKDDEVERLKATGQIIGPFPGEKYRIEFTTMDRGDILLLFTDGITEAFDDNKEMYGDERLERKLRSLKDRSPKEISQLILEEVQLHNRLVEYSDDKTLVVIKKAR